MEPLLSLPADQFRAALAELQLDPQREADLVRQYRRANSPLAPLFGLLDRVAADDAGEGMQRASMVPVSRPEGMSVAEAVRSGDARLAVPQGVLDAISGLLGGIDAPAAAARGLLPAQDMIGEAMGTAGVAMGAGGLLTRPAGSVGMGGRMLSADDVLDLADDDFVTLYHGTTREGADAIRNTGRLRSAGEPSVYLTTDPTGGGYGDGTVVPVRVRRGLLQIDDEFPDGRADFRIDLNRPGGSVDVEIPETPAQQVARLLREGRADEVTDNLMAQADPQEMYRLYVAGETGMDLPMDEASRMARAAEMGRVDDQYHATFDDFAVFIPSETGLAGRGIYTGDSAPDVLDYARSRRSSTEGLNIIPVMTPSGSTYARNIDYQNTLDADPDLPYNATWEQNVEGMRRAADTMSAQGFFGVHSQPGERVTFEPRNIRSRFARFDPRLSHLANLNAANVSPLAGLLAIMQAQEPRQ